MKGSPQARPQFKSILILALWLLASGSGCANATPISPPTAAPTVVPAASPTATPATAAPTLAAPTATQPLPTATLSVPTASPTPGPVELVAVFTGGDNPFSRVSSLAFDLQGNLLVVDSGNNRLQKLDASGASLAIWGKLGTGQGEFSFPRQRPDHLSVGGVAVDGRGNVYVVEAGNDRVQKFDPAGKFLTQWGSRGSGDGQFLDPIGIAVDREGTVYVVDDDRDDIQKFDSQGKFLLKIGSEGTGDGQLQDTGTIALDAQGNLWLADFHNQRVQEFDPNGKFLLKRASLTCSSDDPVFPEAIAVDGQGNLYITAVKERGVRQECVQKLDPNGKVLNKWGQTGRQPGEFHSAQAIILDAAQNIYVADYDNNRIQKFRQK